jgi:fermentation-respiration switch protein FrsA (DUF1100 family)
MNTPLWLALISISPLAVIAAAWLIAGWLLRRRQPDPPAPPDHFGLPFEPVSFTSRDGIRLRGWLIGTGDRPTLILCAGMFGSMDGDTHMVAPLIEAGFDVLQFDWRAHGGSEGDQGTLGVKELLDLQAAVDFLAGRGLTRIGVLGFSFGGALAIRAAATDQRIRALVCDGGFVSLHHAMAGLLREKTGLPLSRFTWLALWFAGRRLGIDLQTTSPLKPIGLISPRPVLLIHGADDPLVPPADQQAIFAACGDPKALWQVAGVGHREAHEKYRAEYLARVIDFFHQHLKE